MKNLKEKKRQEDRQRGEEESLRTPANETKKIRISYAWQKKKKRLENDYLIGLVESVVDVYVHERKEKFFFFWLRQKKLA